MSPVNHLSTSPLFQIHNILQQFKSSLESAPSIIRSTQGKVKTLSQSSLFSPCNLLAITQLFGNKKEKWIKFNKKKLEFQIN